MLEQPHVLLRRVEEEDEDEDKDEDEEEEEEVFAPSPTAPPLRSPPAFASMFSSISTLSI